MKISAKKYAVALYQLVMEAENSQRPEAIKNFVALLARQNRLALVPQIIEALEQYWLKQHSGLKVEITTAALVSTKNQGQ